MKKIEQKSRNKPITLDDLPQAVTHVEEYLSYLAGKTTNFAHLPTPVTPVEEFLYYLCYHKQQGGGGGQAPAFIGVTDVTPNQTNTGLTITKSDGSRSELLFDDIIEELSGDHITKVELQNKELLITNVDNIVTRIPLTKVLDGADINFTPVQGANPIVATDVQAAIEEVNNKALTDITFTKGTDAQGNPNNTLKKTKGGQETPIIDHVVTRWLDLETVGYANLMDYGSKVTGKWYPNTNSEVEGDNWQWSIYKHTVKPGEKYTILRNYNDSGRFVFLDEHNTKVSVLEKGVNGDGRINQWYRYYVTVPEGAVTMGFCFQHADRLNGPDKIMLLKGDSISQQLNFMPYADGSDIVIGKEVAHAFTPVGTLTSSTIHGAIRELDRTKVGLNAQGVIDKDKLPNLAINDFFSVQDDAEALALITSDSLDNGDVVVVRDRQNAMYMWMGKNTGRFDDDFNQLNVTGGGISSVNTVRPTVGGDVTVEARHIPATGGTVQAKLDGHDNEINTIKNTMVKYVNGESVQTGTQNILLNGTHIQATVGGANKHLQGHLDDHNTRITTLESKVPTVRVGDIITSYKYDTERYTVGGVTYIHCGTSATFTRNEFPDLATVLGQGNRNNFNLPYIPRVTENIPSAGVNVNKYTYIVAKIG